MAHKTLVDDQLMGLESELQCPICLCTFTDPYSLPCNHIYCHECLLNALRQKSECPLCKLPVFKRSMAKNHQLLKICNAFEQLQGAIMKQGQPRDSIHSQIGEITEQLRTPDPTPARTRAARAPRPIMTPRTMKELFSPVKNGKKPEKKKEEPKPKGKRRKGAASKSVLDTVSVPPIEEQKDQPVVEDPVRRGRSKNKNEEVSEPKQKGKKGKRTTAKEKRQTKKARKETTVVMDQVELEASSRMTRRRAAPRISDVRKERVGILPTGIVQADMEKIKKFASTFTLNIQTDFSSSVTHIITNTDEIGRSPRTTKYFLGIASGAWILGLEWIQECLKRKKLVDEEPYEILGDLAATGGSKSARIALQNGGERLLHDKKIVVYGPFGLNAPHRKEPAPAKADLVRLVEVAGGKAYSSIPSPVDGSEVIVFDGDYEDVVRVVEDTDLMPVTHHWLLDCFSNYQVLDQDAYQLFDYSESDEESEEK